MKSKDMSHTTVSELEAAGNCLKQGVLENRRVTLFTSVLPCFSSSWSRNHFVLTPNNLLFKYIISKQGGPIGTPMVIISVETKDSNTFEVTESNGDKLLMKTASHASCMDWVKSISTAIAKESEHHPPTAQAMGVNVRRRHASRNGSSTMSEEDVYVEVSRDDDDGVHTSPHSPKKVPGSTFSYGLLHKMLN